MQHHKYTATEGIDPVTEKRFPLYHPRNENWADHFAWDFHCVHIVGLTGTGRATVIRLNLNRVSLVNLRRLLSENGLHP